MKKPINRCLFHFLVTGLFRSSSISCFLSLAFLFIMYGRHNRRVIIKQMIVYWRAYLVSTLASSSRKVRRFHLSKK